MPNLYFITNRVSKGFTGGEFCNQLLLKGAARAGFSIECWEGDRYGSMVKNIVFMNLIYLYKAITMSPESYLVLDMDFHARYIVALAWAKNIRKAKIIGILYHYNYHDKSNGYSRVIHRAIEQWVSKNCDYLITISKFSADNFQTLSDRKIPIFINTPFSRNEETPLVSKACFDPKLQRLLIVGSVERRKNIINTMHALSLLKTPFVCDIVGFWPSEKYLNEVKSVVASLGLEEKVHILGRIENNQLENIFTSATVFLLVSLMEGYGIVYAEAMAYGLPVVGTTRGAVPEIVTDGENGFLCDPENIQQIAESIEKLFHRETWERISRNNSEKAIKFKTKAQFENKGTDIFRRILATPGQENKLA